MSKTIEIKQSPKINVCKALRFILFGVMKKLKRITLNNRINSSGQPPVCRRYNEANGRTRVIIYATILVTNLFKHKKRHERAKDQIANWNINIPIKESDWMLLAIP